MGSAGGGYAAISVSGEIAEVELPAVIYWFAGKDGARIQRAAKKAPAAGFAV